MTLGTHTATAASSTQPRKHSRRRRWGAAALASTLALAGLL